MPNEIEETQGVIEEEEGVASEIEAMEKVAPVDEGEAFDLVAAAGGDSDELRSSQKKEDASLTPESSTDFNNEEPDDEQPEPVEPRDTEVKEEEEAPVEEVPEEPPTEEDSTQITEEQVATYLKIIEEQSQKIAAFPKQEMLSGTESAKEEAPKQEPVQQRAPMPSGPIPYVDETSHIEALNDPVAFNAVLNNATSHSTQQSINYITQLLPQYVSQLIANSKAWEQFYELNPHLVGLETYVGSVGEEVDKANPGVPQAQLFEKLGEEVNQRLKLLSAQKRQAVSGQRPVVNAPRARSTAIRRAPRPAIDPDNISGELEKMSRL